MKLQKCQKKNDFLLGRIYFTGDDGYHNFSVFAPMLCSRLLDSNKKVTKWILTGITSEKNKPFDRNFEPTMSNFANDTVILKFKKLCFSPKRFVFIV